MSGQPKGASGPSKTSQVVAVTRAGFARPHSAGGNPDAQVQLCEGMAVDPSTTLQADLAARTRFFDDQVLAALEEGLTQIVVVGAGYDDRALRFATPGVVFYELDHPSTQADKARRLREIRTPDEGPILVPLDFRFDDPAAALGDCGHDPASPSLFICEGVLVYLDTATIMNLLRALRRCAPERSRLAASLATHRPGLESDVVTEIANSERRGAAYEPWLTILPADEHLDLLHQAGWSVREALDASELGPGVVSGRNLLVATTADS